MKAILSIGHSAYDFTYLLESFPMENLKYSLDNGIETVMECGGGPAGNAAYLMGKWGAKAAYAGVIGDDPQGKAIEDEFRSVGVDLTYLQWNRGGRTPFSVILANKQTGSRTLFNRTLPYPPLELEWDPSLEWGAILIDGMELYASLKALKAYPKTPSVLDAGSLDRETEILASLVSHLVCSEIFAGSFTGEALDTEASIEAAFLQLEALNTHCVVMTLGERGSVYRKDNELVRVPAMRVNAIDTTGAGDIYHGAFAYGLAAGFDLEKTIRIATIAAGLSVQKLGARVAIPTWREVEAVFLQSWESGDCGNC